MSLDPDQPISAEELRRTTANGGAATILSQGLRFVIRVASQIAIARLLLPSDYGLLAMVAPVVDLVMLFGNLGLAQALVQQETITQRQVNSLFWIGMAALGVVAIITACLSPAIAWFYHEPRLLEITLVLALLIPLSGLSSVHNSLLSRNMQFVRLATLDVLAPLMGLLIGFICAWLGWGYWSLIAMSTAETITSTVLVWIYSKWRPNAPHIDKDVWSMVKVGGHVTGYGLANYAMVSADKVLLGATQGETALGIYSKGYGIIAQPISQLTLPFGRVALPLLMRLRSDPEMYRRTFRRMIQMMLLVGLPGLVATMVLSEPLVRLLLGMQWEESVGVVSWLCLGGMASSLHSSTYWLFLSQQRSAEQLRYTISTSIISVIGFAIGLPWGVLGVSISASMTFFFLCVPIIMWGATRVGPVSGADILKATIPLYAINVVAGLVVHFLAKNMGHIDSLIPIGILFIVAYLVFGSILLITPYGRNILKESLRIANQFNPRRRQA